MPWSRELSAALDALVERRKLEVRTPGLSLALTDRRETVYAATYGYRDLESEEPVTPDTLFEIGSIGKVFTAVALVQAQEAGLVDLQAPVTDYLPWFAVRSRYDAPITLHHLLTHSAGIIAGTDASPDPRAAVWALRDTETAFLPGEHFYYSDAGYKILGLVLQAVTGRSYAEAIRAAILDPLWMVDTFAVTTHRLRPRLARGYRHLYDDRPAHFLHPLVPAEWVETDSGDGCIVSTAEDMAGFVRMLLNGGRGPESRVLSEEGYRLLTCPHVDDAAYGYGLYVFERDGAAHLGHGGDTPGYEAYIWLDVDHGLGEAMLSTQPYAPRLCFNALDLFRAAMLGRPLPAPPPFQPARVQNAAAYAGRYEGAAGVLTLAAEGERLLVERAGERVALERRGEDIFYANHPALDRYLLRFERSRGEGSPVTELCHGPDWYAHARYNGPREFASPPEWAAYTGHYRAHNPWESNWRVVLRKGELLLVYPEGDEEPLTPRGHGVFQVGESPSPERLRFDQIADGQALRANLSGCDYYRFFTP